MTTAWEREAEFANAYFLALSLGRISIRHPFTGEVSMVPPAKS